MIHLRRREPVAVEPPTPTRQELEQLSAEQLLEIVRSSSSDPAEQSVRQRMAWRELSLRGSHARAAN